MPSATTAWSQLVTARLWPLWKDMPPRGRAAAEGAFIIAAVLAPSGAALLVPLGGALVSGAIIAAGLGGWGLALLYGSPQWQRDRRWQRISWSALLVAAIATLVVAPMVLQAHPTALAGIGGAADQAMAAMTVRNAGVLLLVGLLLRANRQGLPQIGLGRTNLATESLYGVAALGGAFAVHLTTSAVLAMAVGLVRTEALTTEAEQRASTMNELLATSSVPAFVAAMVFAAAFEEIAFRGFVLPRIQQTVQSWVAALLIVSALFGAGHLYEGPLAVIQTAVLGSFFGLVLLWRGHLLPAILAHVGFNAIMMALALWLRQSGAL